MAANANVLDLKQLFSPSNIRQLAAPILLILVLAMMVLLGFQTSRLLMITREKSFFGSIAA